ncbi:hypothetical protein DFH27DRAFT_366778 [Peziza echinospora]|nr:hypothetical protein DFH27DRAFT_366778 [Peziza echinospora]
MGLWDGMRVVELQIVSWSWPGGLRLCGRWWKLESRVGRRKERAEMEGGGGGEGEAVGGGRKSSGTTTIFGSGEELATLAMPPPSSPSFALDVQQASNPNFKKFKRHNRRRSVQTHPCTVDHIYSNIIHTRIHLDMCQVQIIKFSGCGCEVYYVVSLCSMGDGTGKCAGAARYERAVQDGVCDGSMRRGFIDLHNNIPLKSFRTPILRII